MLRKIDYVLGIIEEYKNMQYISIEKLEEMKYYTSFHELLEVWIYSLNRKRELLSMILDCSYHLRQLIEKIENDKRKKEFQVEKEMDIISNAVCNGKQLPKKISNICNAYIESRPIHAKYKIEFDGIHIIIESNDMPAMWFDSYDEKRAEEFLSIVHRELEVENSIQNIGAELSSMAENIVCEMERKNKFLTDVMKKYNL